MTFTKIKLSPDLTLEQIFQAVWEGAKAQGFAQSRTFVGLNTDSTCAYRGTGKYDGLKCNAGHLISETDYHKDMEGMTADDIFEGTEEQVKFIRTLQKIHDTSYSSDAHMRDLVQFGFENEFSAFLENPKEVE